MSNRNTRDDTPSRASQSLIDVKWVKKFFQAGSKSFEGPIFNAFQCFR